MHIRTYKHIYLFAVISDENSLCLLMRKSKENVFVHPCIYRSSKVFWFSEYMNGSSVVGNFQRKTSTLRAVAMLTYRYEFSVGTVH